MKRWLLLSPSVVAMSSLIVGLVVAVSVDAALGVRSVDAALGVGIVIGSGVAAVVAGGAGLLQRSLGRTTVSYIEETERQTRLDPLTGLLNRSGLMEALVAALRRGRDEQTCVGVLFSDLDRFKVVNDSLGHYAGDRLLEAVAVRLRESVRTADVVARFGGDEFVIVCHGLLEAESITKVARSVRAAFEEPFSLADGELVVAPSIGVAVWDPRVDKRVSAEDMVRDADAAMYEAKRTRVGVSVFDADIRRHLVSRLHIEQSLAAAIQSEIVVHYQPVIHAGDKRLSGLEALVRWDHPEHGLLFPADFLSVAEEAGLLGRIGDLVLREACAQTAQWNHIHPGCRRMAISVNVAEQQLLDVSFPDRVKEALEWSGLTPGQLCLEISEDLVTEHLAGSLPVLELIAQQGVRLSLDDFGTGRTTMSHLKRLNDVVHQVKIDRAFIANLPTDPIDQAVVEAVSRIANAAELSVVAEGVETESQARKLVDLGIHLHQGFLYSQAVPAKKLTEVFENAAGSTFNRSSAPDVEILALH